MFKVSRNRKPKKGDAGEAAIKYRKSVNEHRAEIKSLRKAIKKHKMLIKQAELAYKISQTY